MAGALKTVAGTTARAANSFREAIQDLLVPELRAVKVSIEALTQEMRLRNEQTLHELRFRSDSITEELRARTASIAEELRSRSAFLEEELRARTAALAEEMRLRDERQTKAIENLSQKLDYAIDIRERLVQVEARLPRQ